MSFPSESSLINWLQARFLGFEPKLLFAPEGNVFFVVPQRDMQLSRDRCYHEFYQGSPGNHTCQACGGLMVVVAFEQQT